MDQKPIKEVKAELKKLFAAIDVQDTGVVAPAEFIDLIESHGMTLATAIRQQLEIEKTDVNYRVYIDKLERLDSGLWGYPAGARIGPKKVVSQQPRFTFTSEDNNLFEAVNTAFNRVTQTQLNTANTANAFTKAIANITKNAAAAKLPQEKCQKIYTKLHTQRIDHRRLQLLPYVFRKYNSDEVSVSDFESSLRELNFKLPESILIEILAAVTNDKGMIDKNLVNELLNESNFVSNPQKKGKASPRQIEEDIGQLPNPDLQKNLYMILDKLSSRYRMFKDYFRHFDRQKIGKISKEEFEYGVSQLNLYISRDEIKDIFDYLDRRQQGFIEFTDFARIKNEAMSVPRIAQRRTTEHPNIKYNSVSSVVDRPKFNDGDADSDCDVKSRRALYFGKRKGRKSISPIPSEMNPNWAYGQQKKLLSDSMNDVMSYSYQREYIDKMRSDLNVKLRNQLKKPPKRQIKSPQSIRGSMSATPNMTAREWKMSRFSKVQTRVPVPSRKLVISPRLPSINN